MRANNSFKPNLLRSTKAMTEKACHGFGSTTQVGLTQALGCSSQSSRNRGIHGTPTCASNGSERDRESVVSRKGVSVGVDLGGRRISKKTTKATHYTKTK